MFIYSFKASTLRFFAVMILACAALVALIVTVPSYDGATSTGLDIKYDKIKTNDDRRAFLAQFGYEVSSEPLETAEVTLPSDFDRVFSGYNELQKSQGLDLSKYRGKTVMRYTYEVNNYGSEGKVWATVIVYRNRVIGGDVCSADPSGFIHGFAKSTA